MNSKLLRLADGLQLLKKYDDETEIMPFSFGVVIKIIHTKIKPEDNQTLKDLGWYYDGTGWGFQV